MKKTIIAIAVLLFAALLFTGAAAAAEASLGGDTGTIHIHTNVPGAKVEFYLINIVETGQPDETHYADANGDVFIKVYRTGTPPKYAVVSAQGYIKDITSQVSLGVPELGKTLRYDIPLTPIGPTPLPPSPQSPAPVFAVLAALGLAGAAAVMRRN